MWLAFYILLTMSMARVMSSATNITQGCNLYVPEEVRDHMEAEGEPLKITIIMQIEYVRDVPDSGGSFGVVFRQVPSNKSGLKRSL